jgi:hypothetical protein
MKRIATAALLVMSAAIAVAAQQGTVTIQANVPIEVRIRSQAPGVAVTEPFPAALTQETWKLPPGDYAISLGLPDGTVSERVVTIKKNCTTDLAVTYKPPTCPTCVPLTATKPTIATPAEPLPEAKPQPVPWKFDECCGCKRDDLKARLDLFAIQLHSNPTTRGRIIAASVDAINYLVNQRRVDSSRLELQITATYCVELWIIP